jgi:oxaloacetate decarboxylase (Na+ extruding) subunit alpha
MEEIRFVDTTFRDGHASLWAEGMTTGMMLPVASQMDRIGFTSIELMGTSHFLKCVRELREDPWERIKLISKEITHTPLTLMMQHSIRTFDFTPFSVMKLWMERIAANGIKRVQVMNASNNMSFKVPEIARFAKEVGLEVIIALTYSYSPKHTDEHYAQTTRDAVALNVDGVYLKDPGGLLTPERIQTLVPTILKNSNGLPVELHSHCTTGLAPLCYIEAIRHGIKTVHTAIPPLANGSSQPSIVNISQNIRHLGFTPAIDEEPISSISNHFSYLGKRNGLSLGSPVEYDLYQYIHQVPGGVISNLKHQLSLIRMGDRLGDVLEETVRVRKDLGYPIMVTPFSQLVVSQATLNVMSGERYKQISDEVIRYALGFWGKEDSLAIDPNIRDRILSNPRTKDLAGSEPPQPSIDEVRQQIGGPGVSDDELLLRYIIREEKEIRALREAGPIKIYPFMKNPLMALIHELVKIKDSNHISVRKGDFSITLQK